MHGGTHFELGHRTMRTKARIALERFLKDAQELGLEHENFLHVLVQLFKVSVVPKVFLLERLKVGHQKELHVFDEFLFCLDQFRQNLEKKGCVISAHFSSAK